MSLKDLEEDPFDCSFPIELREEEEEFEGSEVQDDLTEALGLLEDCRELLICLLDPNLWEARYVSSYVKRQIGKLETDILAFTDQWQIPQDGGREEEDDAVCLS